MTARNGRGHEDAADILTVGSLSEEVSRSLEDSPDFPWKAAVCREVPPTLPGRDLIVICPGDAHELRVMAGTLSAGPGSSSGRLAAFAPFSVGSPVDGCPICLRTGDTGVRILSSLYGYRISEGGSSPGFTGSLWMRAGALLPFFVHNINNILARIMGNAELARMYSARPDAASEKLGSALAGVEDLRKYVHRLAEISTARESPLPWNTEMIDELGLSGRMFCGRSVEYTLHDYDGPPAALAVGASRVELTVGLASAAAAAGVNGCGEISLAVSLRDGWLEFHLTWRSGSGRTGLIEDGLLASARLMAVCASCCRDFDITMLMDEWNGDQGGVSLMVPLDTER